MEEQVTVEEIVTPSEIANIEPEPPEQDYRIEPLIEEFEEKRLVADQWADALVVTSQKELDEATPIIAKIKKSSGIINQTRLWFVEDMTRSVSKINGLFKPIKDGLDAIEKKAKRKCDAFLDEEDRKRREEQRRLDAEAAKLEKFHQTMATKAAAEGDHDKAQDQLEKSHAVSQDVALPQAQASAGSHRTGRWVATLTDKKAFIRGLASGVIPWDDDLVIIPQGKLNEKARALKHTAKWPGVKFEQERSLSVKAAE